jgi:hypothetical protein
MPIFPASMPPPLPPAVVQRDPLSPADFEDLAQAGKRAAVLNRAIRIAHFNAWTLGILGGLSILIGIFDLESLVMGIALVALAFNESRGQTLLQRFDLKGPRVLGWNQVGLMLLLVAYGAWKLIAFKTSANPYEKEIAATPELGHMLGPIVQMYGTISNWLYGSLIAIAVLYQGGNALYYFSREKHLQAYLRETPAWVIKLRQATAK